MKKFTLLVLMLFAMVFTVQAQERRPIDSQHPLWMIHVDVWNAADPQKIIDLVPENIRPFVCMNLSLSCQYDTEKNVYKMPQNAVRTFKSWATVCQKNGMWFTCQPASGGHCHFIDDDVEIYEYFYQHFPNFLGWNFAEQFWGFDEKNDRSSGTQVSRMALFAKLIPMAHKYGGFLTVSFCGNIWSHGLSPVGMMKRNKDLLQACRDYPDAILWLYKYTQPWCFYNAESLCFGTFISGLSKNYGVRYDNCGYNGALSCVLGENHGVKYPVAAGIGTVLEQTCVNGGAVWDGPELIWTEDFQETAKTTVSGYTRRNWATFQGFENAWYDMFRYITQGKMYIPTREEVVGKTKVVVIDNMTTGTDEQKYATWPDLYDGLYKQTDPMNKDDGHYMNNCCYFKSTGRYGAVPVVVELYDSLAKTITKQVKHSQYQNSWTSSLKKAVFNKQYEEVSTGNLYVNRYRNQLVTYMPFSNIGGVTTASASIPLKYNTCDSLDLEYSMLSSGVIQEYADHINLYLNNYRTDTTTNKIDAITIVGAKAQPDVHVTCMGGSMTLPSKETWDAETGTYTIKIKHNGPIMVSIQCEGNGTDRLTDVVPHEELPTPKQPAAYNGEIIIEAEDMDYKSIKNLVTGPYYSHPDVRGHSGNGFMEMGTSSAGSLRHQLTLSEAGDYTIAVRYTNTGKTGKMYLRVGTTSQALAIEKTDTNEWRKVEATVSLNAGTNTILLNNTAGIPMYIDEIIYTPVGTEAERFAINIREAQHGKVEAPATAAEGDLVSLNVIPDAGYKLTGWTIVHGDVTINDDNTFQMLDDIVTLTPVFGIDTPVRDVKLADFLDDAEEAEIYDLNGRRVQKLQRGINIIRYQNGVSRKVYLK